MLKIWGIHRKLQSSDSKEKRNKFKKTKPDNLTNQRLPGINAAKICYLGESCNFFGLFHRFDRIALPAQHGNQTFVAQQVTGSHSQPGLPSAVF